MKISRQGLMAILAALHSHMLDIKCEVEEIHAGIYDQGHKLEWGVSWGATGTQRPTSTRAMANDLMFAAEIAEKLTELELVVDWSTESDCIKDFNFTRAILTDALSLSADALADEIRNTAEYANKIGRVW